MPKIFFKKIAAHGAEAARSPGLAKFFGRALNNPNLWHLNRYSVSWAVSVGLFMAYVPVPFQMLLAAAAALGIGCNLPIAVALVWISNPITMPLLFYSAYVLGAWVLGIHAGDPAFELSVDWLLTQLGGIWQPFLLGCLIFGLSLAILGNLAVRLMWRIQVSQAWQRRKLRRKLKQQAKARSQHRNKSGNSAP